MTKLEAGGALRLVGALVFAMSALDLVLGRDTLSSAHAAVGSVGLVLLAISAAVDATKRR
jgi:hypothetical protein